MQINSFVKPFVDAKKLKKSLSGAHITINSDLYISFCIAMTLLSALCIMVLLLFLYAFDIRINIIPYLPEAVSWTIIFFVCIMCVFFGMLSYPSLVAAGRKTRIDLDLPYAITYMEALSTNVTLYNLFKSVYEAEDLYGEVSRECGLIVRDVEFFGEDLLTAMRNLQETTPSKNFADLLNDLALVFRTGGKMKDFFDSRSDSYRELAKQELEATLQIMEMIAEVYVTAFVAGPIAIIIMLVAQNLSGQGQMAGIMPLMYIGLPLGAIALIFILYYILPSDSLEISHSEARDTEFTGEIIEKKEGKSSDPGFIKKIEKRKEWLKLERIVKHPFKFFISDYQIGLFIGMLLSMVVVWQYFTGILAEIFPEYTFEVFICLFVIFLVLPVSVAYESRKVYINRVESQMPVFLRDIADMKDLGMTLQGAVDMVSRSKIGVLSSELKIASEEMKVGFSVSSALVRMEERIGLLTVKRAISLIVKASEITDQLREILTIAISDLEHYLKMKSKRFNVSFVYLAVIYLSFGIYLYCSYQLNDAFVASFSDMGVTFDTSGNIRDMFRVGIIIGGFSGIMAGQLSSNNILCGLKHTIVFLASCIVLFVFIL
ncbi:flagellar protein FlaJ [Methanomicrobium sp. W14]|uniref:type II secretion system F family protein n=1 Tax=Methanomicrobium sp. W14 TaxID=2817839 RepID=UPI001AE856FC|nr:type II secretion system F family protein [Methanomicrobium sp. W14]MBP2133482.1 flagellar protein FlaJ [Methanomicrobium sp. W14]